MQKILIVEDEENLNRILQDYLRHNGYDPLSAVTGSEGLGIWHQHSPEMILLDLNLPDMDGLDFLREVRKKAQLPVIIITARVDEIDRLIGLEMGADDYIIKPFSSSTFRSLKTVEVEKLKIDLRAHEASLAGQSLDLTPAEFQLLALLVSEPDKAFSRVELLEVTQGSRFEGYERTIDIHVKNLRQKIRALDPDASYIQTVFGVGYRALYSEK